jgi:hypothetical protein
LIGMVENASTNMAIIVKGVMVIYGKAKAAGI